MDRSARQKRRSRSQTRGPPATGKRAKRPKVSFACLLCDYSASSKWNLGSHHDRSHAPPDARSSDTLCLDCGVAYTALGHRGGNAHKYKCPQPQGVLLPGWKLDEEVERAVRLNCHVNTDYSASLEFCTKLPPFREFIVGQIPTVQAPAPSIASHSSDTDSGPDDRNETSTFERCPWLTTHEQNAVVSLDRKARVAPAVPFEDRASALENGTYQCLECQHISEGRATAYRHWHRDHKPALYFPCLLCAYQSTTIQHLSDHHASRHAPVQIVKPTCQLCRVAWVTGAKSAAKHKGQCPYLNKDILREGWYLDREVGRAARAKFAANEDVRPSAKLCRELPPPRIPSSRSQSPNRTSDAIPSSASQPRRTSFGQDGAPQIPHSPLAHRFSSPPGGFSFDESIATSSAVPPVPEHSYVPTMSDYVKAHRYHAERRNSRDSTHNAYSTLANPDEMLTGGGWRSEDEAEQPHHSLAKRSIALTPRQAARYLDLRNSATLRSLHI